MKRWFLLILLLCLARSAYANPVVIPDPLHITAYVMVLGSAVAIEAGFVTLVLLFWGTEPKPVYIAFAAGNLAVYGLVFLPLLGAATNLWIAEAIIVGLDGILIKAITLYDAVRDDTFRPLKWVYAFLIAAVANVVSYYIGAIAS